VPHTGRWIACLSLAVICGASAADDTTDPAAALETAISAAEGRLQGGDLDGAESLYRQAVFEGWLLTAALERLEGQLPASRDAVHSAALFRVESAPSLRALAAAQLQTGEAAAAAETLETLAARDARDGETRRLLARALAADGRMEAAATERLDEAAALAVTDAELAFLVGTDYLFLKKPGQAERLFARVAAARPIAQTHVLVGRAYRDAGEYDRARAELQAALRQDPAVRRAHYYLGTVALADARTGPDRLDRAIAEFREELKQAPDDAAANDQLGLALLEAGRAAEALPALETAVRADARPLVLFHLGRCLLALDRDGEAATALRRALEAAEEHAGSDSEIGKIHYQLGLALRRLGAGAEAATHLAEAGRRAGQGQGPDASAESSDQDAASPLAALPLWQRQGLKRRAASGLVRSYFNLGVIQAQARRSVPAAERFARAAAFFERAAALDPDFPQVQASLGVAYFNAREFAKATGPLSRAATARPEDRGLKRMLATSWLNTEAWDKAAALLEDDPERETDAALQFAYGLALLRSGRAARAAEVLAGAAAARGDSAELLVLLGQARAQQGKDEDAVRALEGALALDATVAQAHGTLGAVYLRQGRLDEAEKALRAELAAHPADAGAQRDLAAVLAARAAGGRKARE
jgi:tetratricopeptide (TPR) repeat protein